MCVCGGGTSRSFEARLPCRAYRASPCTHCTRTVTQQAPVGAKPVIPRRSTYARRGCAAQAHGTCPREHSVVQCHAAASGPAPRVARERALCACVGCVVARARGHGRRGGQLAGEQVCVAHSLRCVCVWRADLVCVAHVYGMQHAVDDMQHAICRRPHLRHDVTALCVAAWDGWHFTAA